MAATEATITIKTETFIPRVVAVKKEERIFSFHCTYSFSIAQTQKELVDRPFLLKYLSNQRARGGWFTRGVTREIIQNM